jgi:putative ABC transport system substrate-binding protein
MRRREFIRLAAGTAVWPRAAWGQQPKVPVVGLLIAASPSPYEARVRAFRRGLSETGYVEGRNVTIEYRWTYDQNNQLPALAADLVRRQVTVIAAGGTRTALAAKAATSVIPIVFYTVTDPVEAGLVVSLNRPGGNLTGVTSLGVEVGPKRLELLHELVPTATNIALLVNPSFPNSDTQSRDLQTAARTIGVQLHVLHASTQREIDDSFERLLGLRAGGLVISTEPLFTGQTERLAALTLRHAVPAIFQYREFASAGGLMGYGGSFTDPYRQLGVYTGQILKGAKPADLPVQQSTKVELIVNLKTAKALGLTVPLPLLGRADEVIE